VFWEIVPDFAIPLSFSKSFVTHEVKLFAFSSRNGSSSETISSSDFLRATMTMMKSGSSSSIKASRVVSFVLIAKRKRCGTSLLVISSFSTIDYLKLRLNFDSKLWNVEESFCRLLRWSENYTVGKIERKNVYRPV